MGRRLMSSPMGSHIDLAMGLPIGHPMSIMGIPMGWPVGGPMDVPQVVPWVIPWGAWDYVWNDIQKFRWDIPYRSTVGVP